MTELFIRAYQRSLAKGERYDGDIAIDKLEDYNMKQIMTTFWTTTGSEGKLLVISNTPLGQKKRKFLMRQK